MHLTRNRPLLALAVIAVAAVLSIPLGPLAQGRAAAASGNAITFSGQVVIASAFSSPSFGPSGPPPGSVQIGLNVFQSGTESNRQTMLFYNVCGNWQWDPVNLFWNCTVIEGGFGVIPGSAIQSSGGARPTKVSLNLDTSTLSAPDFQRFAGSGGLISVSWNAVPGFTDRSSGSRSSTYDFGGQSFAYKTSGSSYFTSAAAQGTLIGYAVPAPTAPFNNAEMGSMQGMSACRGCTL